MAACTGALFVVAAAQPVSAQTTAGRGSFVATITAQNGSVRLPGVSLTVATPDGRVVITDISDGEGRLRVELPAGPYEVRASLAGFEEVRATVRIEAEQTAVVNLDLPLAGVTERVDVIGNAETAPPTIGETLSTKGMLDSRIIEQLPIRDHNVLSALKLLAGVVQGRAVSASRAAEATRAGCRLGWPCWPTPPPDRRCFVCRLTPSTLWKCCRTRTRSSSDDFPQG